MLTTKYELFGDVITATSVLADLGSKQGWEDRYRALIMLGKRLPELEPADRQAEYQIDGCDSLAWLHVCRDEQERYWFALDSDARIVRGLMAVVLAAYNGQTAAAIQAFDVDTYFEQLGLLKHLSPSRGNGLNAVVAAIKQQVQ